MEDDDREDWLACAAADSALLAHELLWLSRPSERVPWRSLLRRSPPLGDEEAPSASGIGTPAFGMLKSLAWANRAPRSKKARRIGLAAVAKAEEEDEAAAKRARARGSPTTPLHFPSRSGASASGAEEGSISAGDAAAAAMCSRPLPSERGIQAVAPVVARIPQTRPIRRPGKRKNVSELRTMEKLLLEERTLLQKELESRGRKREELKEENERLKRLKLSLQPKSVSKEREYDEDQMQGGFLLPDLNEPCDEDFN